LEWGGLSEQIESGDCFVVGLDFVSRNAGQVSEQSLKAMHLEPVGGELGVSFTLGRLRASRGRDDGGANRPRLDLIVIIEKNGSEELPHMPLDVIGQHARKDVSSNAVGKAMVDGADMQVDRFQTAKSALDARQALEAGHDLLAGQSFRFDTGTNDVDAVQTLFALDVGRFAFVMKVVVFNP
jgi:hypothetical protein